MNSQKFYNERPLPSYAPEYGAIYEARIELKDENGGIIPVGSRLRVVGCVPKVCQTPKFRIEMYPEKYDNKEYFLNLVREGQMDDYKNRIRTHFVTVRKVK